MTPDLALSFPLVLLAVAVPAWAWARDRRIAAAHLAELARLRERESQLAQAVESTDAGIAYLRAVRNGRDEIVDFEIAELNTLAARLLHATAGVLRGRTVRSLPVGDPLFVACTDVLAAGRAWEGEMRADPRLVATSWLHLRLVPVADGVAVSARDVRPERRRQSQLARASVTDGLTGLHNRRGFETLAEQQLRHRRRTGRDVVLFYLDLDDFKPLNDEYGHATGDRALREVARVLKRSVRDSDIVARLGGDEFVILAVDADIGTVPAVERRLAAQLAELNASGVLPQPIGFSVGNVRVSAGDNRPLADLLDAADGALYVRKRSKRATRRAMAALGFGEAPRTRLAMVPQPA